MAKLKIDFDGNWKEAIVEFFPEFIEFFLPKLAADIDFNFPVEFMEQELQLIVEAIPNTPKHVVDKLVKVRLKNGIERWILIHIEIQAYFEKWFSKRMFAMYSLIFARHDEDVVALAVYTSKKTPHLFDSYKRESYGTLMLYKFNAYKIMQQDEAALIANSNIFALFVLANLYVNRTRKAYQQRLELKEKLFELAIGRGIPRVKINRLWFFIDNVMKIPVNLQEEFKKFVNVKLKVKKNKMTIVEERGKYWTNIFAESGYGDTVENLVKKAAAKAAAKERERLKKLAEIAAAKEQERSKIAAAKEQERIKNAIIKLHFKKQWKVSDIAEFLEIPTLRVKKIIAQHIEV